MQAYLALPGHLAVLSAADAVADCAVVYYPRICCHRFPAAGHVPHFIVVTVPCFLCELLHGSPSCKALIAACLWAVEVPAVGVQLLTAALHNRYRGDRCPDRGAVLHSAIRCASCTCAARFLLAYSVTHYGLNALGIRALMSWLHLSHSLGAPDCSSVYVNVSPKCVFH